MPRDTQRQKVYAWEDQYVLPLLPDPEHQLTLDACEQLVHKVYARYGRPAPRVHSGRSNATGTDDDITLPKWARTTYIVLHECAHGLALIYAPNEPGHGPTFMRVYLDLLKHFGNISLRALRKTAMAARLKVAPAAACRPPSRKLVCELARLQQQEQEAWSQYQAIRQQRMAVERQLNS